MAEWEHSRLPPNSNSNWTFIALNLPKQEDSKALRPGLGSQAWPQVGKLVVACRCSAVYNTET